MTQRSEKQVESLYLWFQDHLGKPAATLSTQSTLSLLPELVSGLQQETAMLVVVWFEFNLPRRDKDKSTVALSTTS